jgi:hypothetical protein
MPVLKYLDTATNTYKEITLGTGSPTLRATEIPASADLNNYTSPGIYSQEQNAEAATGANYPAPYAGLLEVLASSAGAMVWQRYTLYRAGSTWGGICFQRTYYNLGWSAWTVMAGEPSLPDCYDTYTPADQTIVTTTRYLETPTPTRVSVANPHPFKSMLVRVSVSCWIQMTYGTGGATTYLDVILVSGDALLSATYSSGRHEVTVDTKGEYKSVTHEATYWVPCLSTSVFSCGASKSNVNSASIVRYLHTTAIALRYE